MVVRKATKVVEASARLDACEWCRRPCCWYLSANAPRWMLFDVDPVVVRRKGLFVYLDFQGVHWLHCTSRMSTW